jgi:hypothetical protein
MSARFKFLLDEIGRNLAEMQREHIITERQCAEVASALREAEAVIEGYGQKEPPIVKGALDAQAEAEQKLFALRASFQDAVNMKIAFIDKNRESLLSAWLAEHDGAAPSEAVLCVQDEFVDGKMVMRCWVERREPKPA